MEIKQQKTDYIFIIGIAIISIIDLISEFTAYFMHYPSVANALLGFVGVLLFLLKKQSFRKVIYFWIILQIVVIKREVFVPELQDFKEDDVWNPSQFMDFSFGMHFNSETSKVFLAVNVLPFMYFVLFRIVSSNSLIGIKFTFSKLKSDGVTDAFFPLKGTISQRMTLQKEKHWLLLELENPIEIDNTTIYYAIVKRKNGEPLRKGLKQQSVVFKLIKDYKNFEIDPESHTDYINVPWVDSR